MIPVDEAKRLILGEVEKLDVIEVGLDGARGRVLAEEVHADRDFPPTDRSAMDGFAVRCQDIPENGATLEIAHEIRAGQAVDGITVGAGQAVRIMTGAIIPPGADAVVMVEVTEAVPGTNGVKIPGPPEPGQHIRRRADDLTAGQRVLQQGAPIDAAEIAALTSVGHTRVKVHRSPVVRVLATGDEIVDPAERPDDHQIRNSNAWSLLAQLEEMGLKGENLGVALDTREGLADALARGLDADLLIVTGGVSMGEYDLVGAALTEVGMRLLFHKVAIRPGKPILVGRRENCLIVGLPGNPVSTFTGFAVFIAPVLRKMMGFAAWDNLEVNATLAARLRRRPGRTGYHLARVAYEEDGFVATPVRTMGSGDVLSLVRANAFVITPAGAHSLEPGTEVPALLWRDFHLR
jgi:molybdopterin molybdotransferase